ncbi:MAG: superoxide dismutase [Bdellovibrionales bacterium]
MKFKLPNLPYAKDALAPFLSAEAMDIHLNGHHKAYVDKTNEMAPKEGMGEASLEEMCRKVEGKLFNNAAQAWNHTFYWCGLSPRSQDPDVNGEFAKAVSKKFGSLNGLKEKYVETGVNVFGSGWVWLVATASGDLDVMGTSNADNPIRGERGRPLWTCDVWEHAYYIDYR